jgi:hypothetical protein
MHSGLGTLLSVVAVWGIFFRIELEVNLLSQLKALKTSFIRLIIGRTSGIKDTMGFFCSLSF